MEITQEYSNHAKKAIKAALLTGQYYTAKELNDIGRTGDSRKVVSRLRYEGMRIDDFWSKASGTRFKYYHYVPTTNE